MFKIDHNGDISCSLKVLLIDHKSPRLYLNPLGTTKVGAYRENNKKKIIIILVHHHLQVIALKYSHKTLFFPQIEVSAGYRSGEAPHAIAVFPMDTGRHQQPGIGKTGSGDGAGGGRGLPRLTSPAVWRSIGCAVSPVSV